MKTLKIVPILLIASMLLTGCDFFRSIVGKPTSKELEKMRLEEIARQKKQRQLDSIQKAQALLEQEMAQAANSNLLDENAGRYHLIFGSYKVEGNAEKMKALLEKKGYEPHIFLFNNGFEVVSAKVFDNYQEALKELNKALEFDICPEDIWVYDINQNLHTK